jgi:dTDP-4-amino-4,6-dideoxygalactose transaminase
MPIISPQTRVPFADLRRHHAPLAGELQAAFERVLGASSFVLGDEVEQFERRFAELCGVRHCVGVASGTAALMIMLLAAGIGPGDEVIVPAHTFIATGLAVKHVGATIVCVDVEAGTGLIDPDAVAAAIGARTAAILPVHLYGQVCAMDELRQLAARHRLALLEDAAQAHGATYRGRTAGSLGDAAAFSFYPSKNLGALGDAGAVCTNDGALAGTARRLRDLGRLGEGVAGGGMFHTVAGFNERLDGMQAAFLNVKLDYLHAWNRTRRELANRYRDGLRGVELLEEKPESPCIYHLFPIRTARDALARALGGEGIATGVHYPLALPDQPALGDLAPTDAPNARDWASRELSLPLFPELEISELEAVLEAVNHPSRRVREG